MAGQIGVGVIGVNADRGWAASAHMPALKALPEYRLHAVSARSLEGARRAAQAFGAETAYGDAYELIADPGVDLVVVTVKVTDHEPYVTAALEAGKMVFCEWPLGRGLAEAERMAALARARGVRNVIGLQARFSPPIRHLRRLVESGRLGTVLGSSMVGSGGAWAGQVDPVYEYLLAVENGATVLSIPCGHALDAQRLVLGEYETLASTLAAVRGRSIRTTDQAVIPITTPDQLAFSGRLRSGALASTYYRGGAFRGPAFRWQINGSEGDAEIVLQQGQLQAGAAVLRAGFGADAEMAELPLPPDLAPAAGWPASGPAANVTALYAQFARDLRDGGREAPDFDHAVGHHRLLDAIVAADRGAPVP